MKENLLPVEQPPQRSLGTDTSVSSKSPRTVMETSFSQTLDNTRFQTDASDDTVPDATVSPKSPRTVMETGNPKVHVQLPARSEMFIRCPTDQEGDMVCIGKEISQGVFVGSCIVAPTKREIVIPIVNTNTRAEDCPIHNLELFPLTHFHVVPTKNTTPPKLGLESSNNIPDNQYQRWQALEAELVHQDLNPEERESLLRICREYADVFHLPGDRLGCTTAVKHTIPTVPDKPPVNQKMYRLPEKQRAIIQEQVDDMLKDGIVQPSKSPWNSPLLVVPKKPGPDGEKRWRVVVDFRKLNSLTIGDAFPLPRIEDILDQLGHSRYFTTLDLASGYHQVLVDKKDRPKTAFSTPLGHYEFKRMPFGLTGAPATFQRLMNHVLTGLQGLKCFVYLDDIVIYGKSLDDHNTKLAEVFLRLRENNLKLQPEKCHFLRKEVVYLGHVCSQNGVLPDPAKVSCVHEFPVPRTVRQVQSFLGFANYYRKFIPNFSKLAEPLNKLLRKAAKFKWTEAQTEAFEALKKALTSPPLLIYPDFTKPFVLTTDASGEALGAVLAQGEIGSERPIAYASRTLNDAERRYSTIEKELLAIVWATKNFRCYLYGRSFTVYTDHRPLIGVFNVKDPTTRLVRFHHKLSEYNYKMEYKPGKYNKNADCLSRIPTDTHTPEVQEESDTGTTPTTTCQILTRAQAKQRDALEQVRDSPPTKKERKKGKTPQRTAAVARVSPAIPPEAKPSKLEDPTVKSQVTRLSKPEEIKTVLRDFHDSPLGGHMGVRKTFKRIRRQYVWKGMLRHITQHIKNCLKCQRNKAGKQTRAPMMLTDTAQTPFEKIYMDIVGPLPITGNGNKYILTVQDDLTRYLDCFPLPDTEASTTAACFYRNVVLRFQLPKKVVTDQGTNFMSQLFRNVCKLLRVKQIRTTAYHPQANGALERAHGPLVDYLRSFVDQNPSTWDNWLAEAAYVHNQAYHEGTKMTPMDALYGFRNDLPSNLKREPEPVYNFDSYCSYIKYKLQAAHQIARENLARSKCKSKQYYDQGTKVVKFHIGDQVLLRNAAKKHKLSPIWLGPYHITTVYPNGNVTIRMGKKQKRVHVNRLKKF